MNGDRLFFVQLYHWFPSILKVITIMNPETLIRRYRDALANVCVPKIGFGIDARIRRGKLAA